MKKMFTTLCSRLSLIAASTVGLMVLTLVGCAKDKPSSNGTGAGCEISFATASDNIDATGSTKGTRIVTSNLSVQYDENIGVTSYFGNKFYFTETLDWQNNYRWFTKNDTYYWPDADSKLDFYAWAPQTLAAGKGTRSAIEPEISDKTISFEYSMEAPVTTGDNAYKDAENQLDLIFAYNSVAANDHDACVPLDFKHALAAIRFKVLKNAEFTLNTITMTSVFRGGSCVYQPTAAENLFVWTLLDGGEAVDFTQTYGVAITPSEVEKDYEILGNDAKGFLLIPQTVNAGDDKSKKLVIAYNDGADEIFEAPLPTLGWEAGKLYTYVIDLNLGEIHVDVDEDFDGAEKKDVRVENTGEIDSYMRVAIVANWVDQDGNIVKPCNWMTEGTLTDPAWTSSTSTGDETWLLNTDGYFYYKKGISKRVENKTVTPSTYTCYLTDGLFNSYIPTTPPAANLDLEFIVIAQAIQFTKDKKNLEYWNLSDAVKNWILPELEKTDEAHSKVETSVPDSK